MEHSSTSPSQAAPHVVPARTVLIVEDNFDNRAIYGAFLLHEGFRVIEAVDGQEGIDLARAQQPDLILMDVSIPLVDGLEATRRLKGDALTAHIPIIVLTAHALSGDRGNAMDAGASAYVAKPAAPREVVSEIRRILG